MLYEHRKEQRQMRSGDTTWCGAVWWDTRCNNVGVVALTLGFLYGNKVIAMNMFGY